MIRRSVLISRRVLRSGFAERRGDLIIKRYVHQLPESPTSKILKGITRCAQIATVVLLFSTLFKKKKQITTEYVGERNEEGKKHGRGLLTYSDGSSYDGEWKDGVMEGQGTFCYKNGDVYSGCFVNNKPHGRGLMMYKNENIYDGEWHDGMRTGDGTLTFANGSVYLGGWKKGIPVDAPDNARSDILVVEEGSTPAPVEPKIDDAFRHEKEFVSDFGFGAEGKEPSSHFPDSAHNFDSSEDRKD